MSFDADYKKGLAFSDRLTKKLELQLVAAYKDALKNVRAQIAEVYAKFPNKYAEMVKHGRLKKLEADIADILKQFGDKIGKDVISGLDLTYKATHGAVGFALGKTVGVTYALPPQRLILEAIKNPISGLVIDDALKENRDYMISQINKTITRGLIKGDSFYNMARELKNTMESNLNKNLVRIVRTEAHKVQSIAQVDSFEYAASKGIEGRKVWIATLDDRTRPDHQVMDGVEADDDGMFTLPDGARCEAPGLTGDPQHDCNCRCSVLFKVDEMPEIRRDKSGITVYQNYSDWLKSKAEDAE